MGVTGAEWATGEGVEEDEDLSLRLNWSMSWSSWSMLKIENKVGQSNINVVFADNTPLAILILE